APQVEVNAPGIYTDKVWSKQKDASPTEYCHDVRQAEQRLLAGAGQLDIGKLQLWVESGPIRPYGPQLDVNPHGRRELPCNLRSPLVYIGQCPILCAKQ